MRRYRHILLLTWAMLVSVACVNPGTLNTSTLITPIPDTTSTSAVVTAVSAQWTIYLDC